MFSSFPGPLRLLSECVPVFWVMLLAMWPGLLSNFLKLIWCVSIVEDNDQGITITKERLRPDPHVVCWSTDHVLVQLIAMLGLGLWCLGLPVLLFLSLLRL